MPTPSRRAVLRLLPALPLLSCALPGAVPDAVFDAAAASELARRPGDYLNGEARAFLARRAGAAGGLLWGTLHFGYDETTVMPRQIRDRFAQSRLLLVEEVLDRMPAATRRALADVARRGLATPDPAALAALGPATLAQLQDAGVTPGEMERFSLAGLTSLVGGRAAAGLQGPLPTGGIVDMNLIGFARSIGTPVQGLEPVDAGLMQRLMFAAPNGRDAAAALRLALRRGAGTPSFLAWVRARYAAGQVAQVAAGLTAWQAAPEDLRRADAARAALLTERNRAWLPVLEAGLGGDTPLFAAFGAAHLLGGDGVVALLRGRGWDVVPCIGDQVPA